MERKSTLIHQDLSIVSKLLNSKPTPFFLMSSSIKSPKEKFIALMNNILQLHDKREEHIMLTTKVHRIHFLKVSDYYKFIKSKSQLMKTITHPINDEEEWKEIDSEVNVNDISTIAYYPKGDEICRVIDFN